MSLHPRYSDVTPIRRVIKQMGGVGGRCLEAHGAQSINR